ncbi:MAG: Fic family protein [Bacteroidales bacterium]
MLEKIINDIDRLQQQIEGFKPLSKRQLQDLRQYYRIGITYTSNAIEGNTLTESETKVVIEEGIAIAGKPLKHHLEAVGHAMAFDHVYRLIKKQTITENDIKKLHRLFYQKIDAEQAGKYRKTQVYITGSQYLPPKPNEVPILMKDLIKWYNEEKQHPVVTAALLHQKFVVIHPFIDGNGRIGRLLMNLHLLKNKLPVTIIPPVLRAEYIAMLEKSHVNAQPFIEFIANCVKQAQLEYLRLLT